MSGEKISRRGFSKVLGAGIAGAVVGAAVGAIGGYTLAPPTVKEVVKEVEKPKRPIPTTPLKIGVITILTGPGAVLFEPGLNALKMEVDRINANGGILGRRVELLVKDSAGKADIYVDHLKKLVLEEGAEFVIAGSTSGEALAGAPVAEDLKVLLLIEEGTTPRLFEERRYKYVFRMNNYDAMEFIVDAQLAYKYWPDAKKWATIGADYVWGRDAVTGFMTVLKKLNPEVEVVSEAWPPLFSTDFSEHITKTMAAKPDALFVALWGGDLITFITQGATYGLFKAVKGTVSITGGEYVWGAGTATPDGILCDTRYYFLYPPWDRWALNKDFNERFSRLYPTSRGGVPGFNCLSSYSAIHSLKAAIEKAYKIAGEWPTTEQVVEALEGLMIPTPGGYRYIRPEDHQMLGYHVFGFTKQDPRRGYAILDPVFAFIPEEAAPPPGMKWRDWVASWP